MQPLVSEQTLSGTQIDKYRVLEEVGFGGMSVVYRAVDDVLEREVALKMLHPHLAKREEARRRFQREARAVAKLRHHNIVEIYDFSQEESQQAYIVTEFVQGGTLREFVDDTGVAFPEIGAMITVQIGEALMHAHEFGVIHRDVKPENVMIRADGVVKLMDFGLAQVRDAQRMTETGSLLGSPAHMAPEVIAGEEPDQRADVFSLGTVLYYAATGELPFEGRNAPSLLRAVTEGRYIDPQMRDPRIGSVLATVIRKSLETSKDDRYQTVAEMVKELREVLSIIGISKVRNELKAFFVEPLEYANAFRDRLIEALEKRATDALADRAVGRAVDSLNRILAVDADNEKARDLLSRLDRRRRYIGYSLGVFSVVAVLVVGVLFSGVLNSKSTHDDSVSKAVDHASLKVAAQREEAEAAAASARRLAAIADGETVARAVSDLPGRILGPRRANSVAESARLVIDNTVALAALDVAVEPPDDEPERVEVVVVEPPIDIPAGPEYPEVLVTFHLHPTAASIWVDGTDLGAMGELPGGQVRLAPGPHRIEYRHRLGVMFPQVETIEIPDQPTFDLPRARLAWVPARLHITADGPAQVIIDGRPVGEAGQTFDIPMESRNQDVRVSVVPEGEFGEPFEQDIRVTANETRRIDAVLTN